MSASAPPEVAQDVLDDLHDRLKRFRPVATAGEHGWRRGVDPDYLAELIDYWGNGYDWRKHEHRIRSMPWTAVQNTETPIRAIHQTAGRGATTVVLLHGWPDSVLRFERLLPMLNDVNVVVPSLPGFPFALPVPDGGLSSVQMAEAVAQGLSALGYDRYVLSAGDVGCDVAEALAASHPQNVSALHLTDISQYHFLADLPTDLSAEEKEYVRQGHHWQAMEGGYMHEQSTKPQTLAVALGDSPAGLAAWLLEKLRNWTDSAGDVESVFTKDEILTWIMAYWVSGAIGTSFTPYAESGPKPWKKIQTPTAVTIFPRDLVNAPREFASRFFNIQHWQECPAGGHFAAWEQPEAYAKGIRKAVSLAT
ncbi:epoxide hydrolase (plasmid) [Arthrobacter sp. D3-18]